MKSKAILALLLVFCVFATVPAQTKPPAPSQPQKPSDDKDDDVVRITTNLVQVDAVVTKDGKLVPSLTADDFEIYEDGKKQTITSFAFISNVPTTPASEAPAKEKPKPGEVAPIPRLKRDDPRRTVALVVDDLGLSAESMHTVRHELRKFIAQELQPNDLVAVMRTSGELGALQQFTNDKRLLDRAVDRLRWNICSRAGVSVLPRFDSDRGFEDSQFACGGDSYDKTLNALRFIIEAMGRLPGRKSLVLLSDSVPMESQEIRFENEHLNKTFPNTRNFEPLVQKVAEKAIRSSVVIYAVDTQGLQYTGPTAADSVLGLSRENPQMVTGDIFRRRSALLRARREGGQIIAEQTGGFQVRNSNSFQLTRIMQEQNGYYLLGYRPTSETFNRRFHHIKAKVKRSGMTLRTRFGFFGVSEDEIGPMQLVNPTSTNLALMSPFGAQDIEVDLISFFTDDKLAGSIVRSFIYIDPKGLTFNTVDGVRQASFDMHGVIFGDNGTIVELHAGGATLRLTEGDYETVMRNGLATPLDMRVKRPGSYQVRVATRDRSSGKIGSAGQFVEVPDLKKKRLAVSGIVLGTAESFGSDVNKMIERPGERRFDRNTDLHFAFVTYNTTSTSNLFMEAKLFRDGKAVYSGPETPINAGNQTDLSRLLINGSLRLSPDLELGNHYLQVVITDKTPKSKMAPVVQWIDFDIVR